MMWVIFFLWLLYCELLMKNNIEIQMFLFAIQILVRSDISLFVI